MPMPQFEKGEIVYLVERRRLIIGRQDLFDNNTVNSSLAHLPLNTLMRVVRSDAGDVYVEPVDKALGGPLEGGWLASRFSRTPAPEVAPEVALDTVPAELRQILTLIDEALVGPQGKALWDVLTATRGPDKDADREQKQPATTSVVRKVAFPRFWAAQAKSMGYISNLLAPAADVTQTHEHFVTHARRAFKALGIEPGFKA